MTQKLPCYALTATHHMVDGAPKRITALVVEHRAHREIQNHSVKPLDAQAIESMGLAATPWGWVCADGQIEVLNIDPQIAAPWWQQFLDEGIQVFQVPAGFTPGQHPLPSPFIVLKANHNCA